jgi:hypothetical protein
MLLAVLPETECQEHFAKNISKFLFWACILRFGVI